MDVIPMLLGETEFKFMDSKDYQIFSGVLDDNLARYIVNYMKDPNADQTVVAKIKSNIGDDVESFTYHIVLRENGTIDLIRNLTPELLLSSDEAFITDTFEKLSSLEENLHKLRAVIPARRKNEYTAFISMIQMLLAKIHASGSQPTYPDIINRIQSNSFVFYNPKIKDRSTGCGVVESRKYIWQVCLNGIRYEYYCRKHAIDLSKRMLFCN